MVDQYRLERLVAWGGMASIFRAIDTKSGQTVALKIPHARDRRALEQCRLESEILARCGHPHLVRKLPATETNRDYLVLEWLDGRPLRSVLDECGFLAAEHAIRISLAICDALEHLHGCGVVHCDLKPENVMVSPEGNIKLIDFATAADLNAKWWRWGRMNREGGSPDYASPDRAAGKRAGPHADLYSLGVVLFEMLTGELPFSGVDPHTAMTLRLSLDAPGVRELNPHLSERLEGIVARALARNRVERYLTVRAMRADLAKALSEESVASAPVLSNVG